MTEDHRTRVGAERRSKMRRRLVESALVVFAEKGVDAAAIDDVIVAAGVSRGTFYNYFKTNAELLGALGEELGNELVELIENSVGRREDPVDVLCTGLRIFLRTATRYRRFASYMWRAGFNASSSGNLIYEYLPRHIDRAIERGSIRVANPWVALSALIGVMLAATYGVSEVDVADDYPDEMVRTLLLGLGVDASEVARLVALPLPDIVLPKDSLIARTAVDASEGPTSPVGDHESHHAAARGRASDPTRRLRER